MKRIGPTLALTTAALLAGGLAVSTPIASAAPAADGTFSVTSVGTNNQITQGPDNNMWVTLDDATKNVARITPAGVVTEYDLPGIASPIGITSAGGNLWVTLNGAVARFDPAAPENAGTTVTTPLADIADPRSITVGPDGNLWTASGDKVLKIPPAAPATATTYAATGVLGARAISRSGDFLWVADFGGAQVVRVATDGTGTAFATGGGPQGVAGGAGGQVAYANPGSNPHTIGLINPTPPTVTVPSPLADPFGVTFANDQAYWVAQFAAENLARVTATGHVDDTHQFPGRIRPPADRHGPREHRLGHVGHRREGGSRLGRHAPEGSRDDHHQGTQGEGHHEEVAQEADLPVRFVGEGLGLPVPSRSQGQGPPHLADLHDTEDVSSQARQVCLLGAGERDWPDRSDTCEAGGPDRSPLTGR